MLNAVATTTNHSTRQVRLSVGLSLILAFAGLGFAGCSGVVSGNGGTNTPTPPAGDTTAPTVSITSPAAGATVSGTVNLTANASDNVGVANVQFKVDGSNVGGSLTAAPFSFLLNTSSLSNASHSITAVATDTSGNTATSAAVTVTVNNTTSDTTPPTVSITSPANAASVSGTVNVTANASDNVSVASVQFQLDGANVGTADTASPYAFSWNSATASNGSHTLRAVAKDGAGNTTTSAAVTVTVSNATPDTTAPTVSITSPASGATVSGTVSVTANASDNVGVASVQFQLDGANVGSLDTASPYSFSWNTATASNGSHSVRAIAKDAAGNSTTSAAVTVTVNNTSTSDTTAPSVPTGLTASAASSSQINLTWNASTDNVAVTGYNVFRAGTKVGTSTTPSYSDTGLTASTSFSYTVSAFDAAGNTSAQSTAASATTLSGSTGSGQIPTSLGWFQIPNTQLAPNCPSPSPGGNTGCSSVILAWSGGAADTTGNRMIVWGGGHQDYYGNEVYTLNLGANPITMTRVTNPSAFNNACTAAQSDGNPTSRHTYGGLTYMPSVNKMYAYSGAKANCGFAGPDTWTLNLSNFAWQRQDPTTGGPPPACSGCVTDWDPNTNLVYNIVVDVSDLGTLWSFNPATNTYQELQSNSIGLNLNMNGAIDPGRKLFFGVGNGEFVKVNIATGSSYVLQDISGTASGCSAMISATAPGFAYDPVQKLMVAWAGGNSVILYNPDTNSCSTVTYSGGPGAEQGNGTFGRFRYFPSLGVFVLVNDWQQNAYSLRLTAATGGTGGGSGPTISNVGVSAISTGGGTVNWTTDVTSTSQVEYGTTTSYGASTTLNSTMVTGHSVALSGLNANTLYHYRVHSKNSSGVESIGGDAAFQTNTAGDTQAPTVSITSPANGATVSSTISVSASASDNVGVTSVQLLVDGGAVGSADTATPYTFSVDTTTLANGAHTISAQARDAANNMGTAVAVNVTVSNTSTPPSSALQDFQNRCAASGVVLCQGFDDASVMTGATWPTSGLYPGDTGTLSLISLDSTIGASGSSLKFTIPALAGSDPAGYWRQLFNSNRTAGPTQAQVFGQNSTFYIQFRQRFDSAFLGNQATAVGESSGGTTWKMAIISNDTATCANEELTLVNHPMGSPNPQYPFMYSQCGADPFQVSIANFDYLNEQGANPTDVSYNCHYQAANNVAGSCFTYPADTWVTFYIKVQIGTWGSANSSVQAWVALPGQGYVQFINMPNHVLLQDSGSPGYDMITLIPYWSFRDANISGGLLSHTWYDELIVSSQPIAVPQN